MINQFKITVSNNNLYREIEVPFDVETFSIGTGMECNFRLRRELFFEDIKLTLYNNDNKWSVMCSDNVYITLGDARKLITKAIVPGETLSIKYQQSDYVVFKFTCNINFDSDNKKYERSIDIGKVNNLSIGAADNSNIILKSGYIYGDQINLVKCPEGLRLNILKTGYGIYHNGNNAVNGEVIRSGDFISIADFSFYYKGNSIWTEIRDDCIIAGLPVADYRYPNNYPNFKRNTRLKFNIDDSDIEILDPPNVPTKPQNHIMMSLLPSIGMLVASGVMAFMGGAMIIFSIVSGVIAIITTVAGLIQNKKDYKQQSIDRVKKYNNYVDNKEKEIQTARNAERESLEKKYINEASEIERLNMFSPDLFDRRPTDDDFLCVRLGTGQVESLRKVNYKKQEKLEIEDNLQEIPGKLCEKYKILDNAPVVCDFKGVNAVGIVGNDGDRLQFLKNIVVDIISRQFYTDVKLFLVVDEEHAHMVDMYRYLPYINNEDIRSRNIVCDEESKKLIFEYLYNILTYRNENKDNHDNNPDREHYVLLFYDQCGLMQHPVSKFIDKAKELGVTFVFFGNEKSDIPMGCGRMINLLDDKSGQMCDADDVSKVVPFYYDNVSDVIMDRISRRLASVQTEEVSLEGSLTKNINLFALLNIFGVEDLDLKKRWASTAVYKSMAVPLGVSKTGVVYLDLHDKAHGPHGLVAGTTGSGKSEILQTYILSIATYFHPYEVAFLIIDFKGGGMVNQFRNLPHLLGAITNIDGKEINRSLKSIKAELQKRQRLFAQAGVNHIDKYIMKYKSGEAKEPLPHLVIIVDEFAELKAEQPDFMKELISAARIGRSLGVHLILATQKPAGQVDDQIWSNSRFKLCLKVQGPEDSNEVLKSPLAAEIKEPGRAYLQVGNNEIFELFQSAYSGDSEKAVDNYVKPFKVSEVAPSGKRKVIYEQKKASGGEKGRTQLDAIVEYVHDYCEKSNIKKLPNICLASLGKKLMFNAARFNNVKDCIDIGIYDDPDNQYQGATFIDINTKNTFILGSSQYGKTNLLQLAIREIAMKYTPEEANIYILDFGSMVLKVFEKLNHVGGVVCSSDDEKLKNLFKLLSEEIVTRKEKIVSVGVSSFSAYVDAGYKDLPHIYVMVDNMTALQELYLENDDTFMVIIREGLSVGITTIVANSQTAGISYRYLSNFANKIALYCNDASEYNSLFDHVVVKPDEVVGRAILEINKTMLEAQTYQAFSGDKEFERSKEIRSFISSVSEKYGDVRARQIPYIPNVLTKNILYKDFKGRLQGYKMPVAVTYSDVVPFYIDFATLGAIGICGKEKRGHYNFVAELLKTLNDNREKCPAQVCIFDNISRKYKGLADLDIVKEYTLDAGAVKDVLASWHEILQQRYEAMLSEATPENNDLLVLIIQNNDVAKAIADDFDLMPKYRDIVSKYRAMNVCIIYANYQNSTVSYDAPEPLRMIKQEKHLLCFDDLSNLKVFDVDYENLRANKKKLQLGDAYYINDNEVTKLKMLKHED